jgi:hypothetical protein
MTLLPRKFKIEDSLLSNEDVWYAVWMNIQSERRWAIQFGIYFYDYFGTDTLLFSTPEEAAEYLVKMRGQKPKIG